MRLQHGSLVAGVAFTLALTACSGASTTSSQPTATTASGPATTVAGNTATAGGSSTKVSANNASKTELTTALNTAGVPNASRWAQEVSEYRPYPSDDPNFTKLRDNLAKYNPGPGVVDRIVATLGP